MAASLAFTPQFDFQSENPFDARLILDGLPGEAETYAEGLIAFASTAYVTLVGPAASALIATLLHGWRLATLGSLKAPSELPLGVKTSEIAKSIATSPRGITRLYRALCQAGLAKPATSPFALAAAQLSACPRATPYREGKRFVLCADKLAADYQAHRRQLVESVAKANRLASCEAANIMASKSSDAHLQATAADESLIVPEPPAPRTSSSSRSCSRSLVLKQGLEKYPSLGAKGKGDSNTPNGKVNSRLSGIASSHVAMVSTVLENHGISVAHRKGYKLQPAEFVTLEMKRRGWSIPHLEEYLQQPVDQGDSQDLKAVLFYRLKNEKDAAQWAAEREALAAARQRRHASAQEHEARAQAQAETEERERLTVAAEVLGRVEALSRQEQEAFLARAMAMHRGIYLQHSPQNGKKHPCPDQPKEACAWWLGALGLTWSLAGAKRAQALLTGAPAEEPCTDPAELEIQRAIAALKARLPKPKD